MIRDHLVQAIEDVCDVTLVHYGKEYDRFHHAEGPKIHLGHVYQIGEIGIKICTDMLEGHVKYVGVWAEFAEGKNPTISLDIDADADVNGTVNWIVEQLDNAGFKDEVKFAA